MHKRLRTKKKIKNTTRNTVQHPGTKFGKLEVGDTKPHNLSINDMIRQWRKQDENTLVASRSKAKSDGRQAGARINLLLHTCTIAA